ncbi:MAG: hypothetical protein ACXVHX_26755 [Solirubrobacteraceae bacterium]
MTRVVLNRAFKAEVQREPEFVAAMKATTINVAVEVKRVAPDVTGYYLRHVKPFAAAGGYFVLGTDPFSHLVEAGSVNNPPYAPLQIGARAAGLHLVEEPKK